MLDFESRQRYSPRAKGVEYLGGTAIEEGNRIRLSIDRNTFTVNVESIQPPRWLVTMVKGPGFRLHYTYDVKASGEHSTVTITGSYQGLLGRLFSLLMKKSFHKDLSDELVAIKAAAETSSPVQGDP